MPALRGADHPAHKLNEQAVREIRAAYRPGWISYRDIAERYGCSLQLIAQVVKGQAWAWVEDDGPPHNRKTQEPLGLFFYGKNQDAQ